MSAIDLIFYRRRIKQMGAWAGVRFLRNRGVSFALAHFIVLGIFPRRSLT